MILNFGRLQFEENEVVIERTELGDKTYLAAKGHNCRKCVLKKNCLQKRVVLLAQYCVNTHFINLEKL